MANQILNTARNEAESKSVGNFDRKRMELALASKSTLIPPNLGARGIVAFITKSRQNNLIK